MKNLAIIISVLSLITVFITKSSMASATPEKSDSYFASLEAEPIPRVYFNSINCQPEIQFGRTYYWKPYRIELNDQAKFVQYDDGECYIVIMKDHQKEQYHVLTDVASILRKRYS